MNSEIAKHPAPWHLKGEGFIILFRMSRDEIIKDNFLTDKFKKSFRGGFGSIMIVDYESSNAGPYSELLFIPGKFRYNGKNKNTIPKIYVSTPESIINGINNWAIPKEKASFDFSKTDSGASLITCHKEQNEFFHARIKPWGLRFPVNTAFMPFPLVQEKDGKAYYTKFNGKGTGRLAKVIEIDSDADLFPKIDPKKILLVIKVENFRIEFPVPEIAYQKL